MTTLGERLTRLSGGQFGPRQFDEDFAPRDQNRDGYLTFEEFTQGACKKGYLDHTFPPLPPTG